MFLRSSLNQLKGSKSEKQTMEFYQLSNEHSKKSQRKKPEQDLLDKDTIKIDKQPKKLLNKNTEKNSQIETSPLPLLTKRKQKKPQQMKDCSDEEVYFEQASPLLYKKKKQQQLSNDCSEEEIEAASTNLKKPKQLQRKHSKDQSDEDLQQKFAREQNLPSRSKHQTSRSNCSYYEDDNAADDEEEEEECYSSNNACLFQKSINSKASHSSVSSRFDAGESKRVDLTSFVTRTYGDALPAEKINQEVDECIQLAKKQIAQKSQITEQRAQQLKKQFPKLFCLIHRKLYETEEKYVQHTIKYHPDVAIEENLAGFKCLKCLRIFVSYGWWEKHIILCQGLAEKLATLSNSDRKLFLLGLRIKSTM